MFAILAALILLPVAVSVTYVAVWPGVAARPALIAAVGSAIGIVCAAACVYWAAVPLTRVGIASGTDSARSLGQLLGPRLFISAVLILCITVLATWVASRAVSPRA